MENRKINVPVLVVTLCLALCLIATGVVIKVVSATDATTTKTNTLYSAIPWSGYKDVGDKIVFKFTPSYSGDYLLYGDGISITSVKSASGSSISTSYSYGTDYDVCKTMYLSSGTSYNITVKATKSYQVVLISPSYSENYNNYNNNYNNNNNSTYYN